MPYYASEINAKKVISAVVPHSSPEFGLSSEFRALFILTQSGDISIWETNSSDKGFFLCQFCLTDHFGFYGIYLRSKPLIT